jgi:hypothetical protein
MIHFKFGDANSAQLGNFIDQLPTLLLALLGGFSADGVVRILNRLVAMLIALVQGDTKDIIQENGQKWKNTLESENSKYKLDKFKKILDFYNKNNASITGNLKVEFDKLLQDFDK